MNNKIEKFLNNYNLLEKGKIIIVGFSGGYDSMCLLYILKKLAVKYDIKLIAAHLNHNWRAEEALKEAQNCEQFCKNNNIIFYTETLDKNEKHTETVARELRYKFFNKAIEKYSADALLTAHTKSDTAETITYRIIKGTGIKGLQGIAPKIGKIYRPMLDISRCEIEEYTKNNNLSPNIDSSNRNNIYARNFIRNIVLKKFETINKNVENALNSLSILAFEEEKIVHEYINSLNLYKNNKILTEKFINLSFELKKRIIYEIFVKYDIEYTQEKILETLNFVENNTDKKSGSKTSLNATQWLFVSSKVIEVISEQEKINDVLKVTTEGSYSFADKTFTLKKCDKIPKKYPLDSEFIAYVNLPMPIDFELRTRNIGDMIVPLGSKGEMKLKKYLISKNIPQHEKDSIILLCKGSEILWVSGLGINDKIKVVNQCTHVLTLE